MIDITNNVFEFFKHKVILMENGLKYIAYTNNIEEYISIIKNNIHIKLIDANIITPNKSQVERLDILNKTVNISDSAYWISEINQFVEHGFIHPNTMSILSSMMNEYTDSSREYIISQKIDELSAYRYKKETSGVVFMDDEISTERDHITNMHNLLRNLELEFLNTLCFKTKTKWVNYSIDEFKELMKVASIHIENCFLSERIVFEKLNDMSLHELLSKDEDGNNSINIENMFDETYNTL